MEKGTFQQGFTLVELMIVITIVAILAAIAVPSYNDFVRKSRVKGAAEEIYGLILQAKSEAPIRDADISVSIKPDETPWCVGFSEAAACDCTDATSCVVDVAGANVTQIITGTEYPNVTITENFSGAGPKFKKIRRSANGGSIVVESDTWQLKIIVSLHGRIRLCNPNDESSMLGFKEC